MADKHQITLTVQGKKFPILVTADTEAAVLAAGKLVDEKIQAYKTRFSVRDDSYLTLMCSLDLAAELLALRANPPQAAHSAVDESLLLTLNDKVNDLEQLLELSYQDLLDQQ